MADPDRPPSAGDRLEREAASAVLAGASVAGLFWNLLKLAFLLVLLAAAFLLAFAWLC